MTIRQGHNVIAGGSGRQLQDAFPLFFDHRFAFDPQDIRWVNSEDYSWLDGDVYRGGYNKLLSQYQPTGIFKAASLNYTCVFSDLSIVETNVPVATGTLADLQDWATAAGYTTTGTTIEELVVQKSLASSSETIAEVVISFYRCYDKKKIVLTDQIAAVEAIYAATGVAEYFILDIANKQFKLPRNKWGKYGTGSGDLGDYISESLPNIKGRLYNFPDQWHNPSSSDYDGALYPTSGVSGGTASNKFDRLGTINFDASRSSSTYQDNAPVQPRGAKGDLYFYLGSADIGVLADIASIKAETINKKADRDLSNVSRNLLSGYEFSVVQETVVVNQAYSLDLPHAIDCSKYKVEAVIEFKSIVGNFEVGDRVPLNSCWGMNYRSISYWYNNTKVGFGSSDQISCLPRGTSNGNTNVVSYIRVIFEFYKIKD